MGMYLANPLITVRGAVLREGEGGGGEGRQRGDERARGGEKRGEGEGRAGKGETRGRGEGRKEGRGRGKGGCSHTP